MPLTPQDVRDKVFRPTRLRRGYDEDEVDAFLDEVEAELGRLLNEIGELQRQLPAQGGAAPDRSSASAAGAPGGPELTEEPAAPLPVEAGEHVPAAALPSGQEGTSPVAPKPGSATTPGSAPGPSAAPARQHDAGTGLPDSEAEQLLRRTLVLAQRTAEQAVQEARLDAERLRGDAQRTYEEQIGRIEEDRRRLEGQVDQLRSFEREYRTRLRAYLEMQLRELDKAGAPPSGASAVPASARQPLTPGTPGGQGAGGAGNGPAAHGAGGTGAGDVGGSPGAGGTDAGPGQLPGSGQLAAARTAATAASDGSAAEPNPAPG